MKYCNKCNININGKSTLCPLCKNTLNGENNENVFPYIPTIYKQYDIFFKILIFLSLLAIFLTSTINYLIDRKLSWSLFVLAGISCVWLSIIVAVKKRNDISVLLLNELLLISFGSIAWDYFTGWHLWSITYVLPFVCMTTILSMSIISIVLKYTIHDYFIYIYCEGIIGLIPIFFIITKVINIYWPSICSIIFSFISLLSITVFTDKGFDELKRRFHV